MLFLGRHEGYYMYTYFTVDLRILQLVSGRLLLMYPSFLLQTVNMY